MTAELLTDEEHEALAKLGEVAGLIRSICGQQDPGYSGAAASALDWQEAVVHLHALQRMVGAQAAARAFPAKYRLLGSTVWP